MLLATLVRYENYLAFRRYFSVDQAHRYGRYFVIGAGGSGAIWGTAGVLLYPPDDLLYQLLLVVMLVGVGAGAVAAKHVYLPGFYAFLPMSLMSIVIQMFWVAGTFQVAMGLGVLAYIIAVIYYAIAANRSLVETLTLRYQNLELVEQLRKQKDEAECANIAKSKFLAAASHDLRQPLHALTLFTSSLDEVIRYPGVRDTVEKIKASVRAGESVQCPAGYFTPGCRCDEG